MKAATTDRQVILKARVIDGITVMKVKEEKARQAEQEARQVLRMSCDRLVSAATGAAVTLAVLWLGLVFAAAAAVILHT